MPPVYYALAIAAGESADRLRAVHWWHGFPRMHQGDLAVVEHTGEGVVGCAVCWVVERSDV